jgi:septal ring factor EnvC (AmiA/AmiB activator)
MLNGEKLSQPPSRNHSNLEVPSEVLLHDEADEPSYSTNILPSATVSRVEEGIVEMKSICQDLLSQISRLSLEVEEERSQRIQIKSEYEIQLADAAAKFTKECQQLKQMLRDNKSKSSLPKQQQLICKQINSKLMGEQSSPCLKLLANEANAKSQVLCYMGENILCSFNVYF